MSCHCPPSVYHDTTTQTLQPLSLHLENKVHLPSDPILPMDPLSITASIIGIGAVATSTSGAFRDLRKLCKSLPGRLHTLSNEVSDFEVVLHRIASLYEKRQDDPVLREQEAFVQDLLDQAESKLSELRDIVEAIHL